MRKLNISMKSTISHSFKLELSKYVDLKRCLFHLYSVYFSFYLDIQNKNNDSNNRNYRCKNADVEHFFLSVWWYYVSLIWVKGWKKRHIFALYVNEYLWAVSCGIRLYQIESSTRTNIHMLDRNLFIQTMEYKHLAKLDEILLKISGVQAMMLLGLLRLKFFNGHQFPSINCYFIIEIIYHLLLGARNNNANKLIKNNDCNLTHTITTNSNEHIEFKLNTLS